MKKKKTFHGGNPVKILFIVVVKPHVSGGQPHPRLALLNRDTILTIQWTGLYLQWRDVSTHELLALGTHTFL